MRALVVAIAVLGLAAGSVLGLVAPASADGGFSGSITNLPVTTGAEGVNFAGAKTADSVITAVALTAQGANHVDELANCSGVAAGSASWSCAAEAPSGGFTAGDNATIEIVEQDADGTISHSILAFKVFGTPAPSPSPEPAVQPTVTFKPGTTTSPGTATVTTTPKGNADDDPAPTLTGTQLYIYDPTNGDFIQGDSPQGCPAAGDDGDVFPVASGEVTCTFTIPAALWLAESGQALDEDSGPDVLGNKVDNVFSVLDPPRVNTDTTNGPQPIVKNGDGSVAIAGYVVGSPTADVAVFDQNGTRICTAPIVGGSDFSNWTCDTGVLTVGTHKFYAATEDLGSRDDRAVASSFGYYYLTGALSKETYFGQVIVAGPKALLGGGTTPGDMTPTWSFTIGGDLNDVHPGDTLTINGDGLPVGTTLDTILHSVPTDLGSVVSAADGTFTQTVTIPKDTPLGAHDIIVNATGPGLVPTTHQQPITVTSVPDSGGTTQPTTGTGTTKTATGIHNAGSDANGNGTAIQPNILTQALTPFADVAVHPNKIVSAIEIGLVLLLLAVLPAHLLNATLAEQSERIERRFKRLPKRPQWFTSLLAWFTSAPVAAGLVVTLVTAVLFGFADPKFGFTLASLRLILACGIALFLVGYVANWLTSVIARNQWHITVLVNTRPYGLILTVVGVLVSRVLHFSPGFLIGLILGLTIQGKSATGFAWRTVVTRTCIVLAMSIAAWIGYSTLTLGSNEGGTFGTALIVETLVAIVTEGIVALLVELLPIRSLEGERVYAHSRALWGILYFLTLVMFVLAVVPWEGNWDALGNSLWTWIVVLGIFAAVCVGIYIYFRRFAKPLEEEAGDEEVPLAAHVTEK